MGQEISSLGNSRQAFLSSQSTLNQCFRYQHHCPNRDATIRQIEHRERAHLHVIRDETVPQTINNIGERATENQTIRDATRSGPGRADCEHEDSQKGRSDEEWLDRHRETQPEGDALVLREDKHNKGTKDGKTFRQKSLCKGIGSKAEEKTS